jgi:hypothetical protein
MVQRFLHGMSLSPSLRKLAMNAHPSNIVPDNLYAFRDIDARHATLLISTAMAHTLNFYERTAILHLVELELTVCRICAALWQGFVLERGVVVSRALAAGARGKEPEREDRSDAADERFCIPSALKERAEGGQAGGDDRAIWLEDYENEVLPLHGDGRKALGFRENVDRLFK